MRRGSDLRSGARSTDIALYGVYEVSKLLTTPAPLEVTLGRVLHLLSSFLDMRNGLIALLRDGGAPELVVGSGVTGETAQRYFGLLPERVIGSIVATQMPVVVESVKDDPLFASCDVSAWGGGGDISFMGVPIVDRGNVVGTLTIDRERGAEPEFRFDEDIRFLKMIANLLGQTVRLHRLIARDRERLIEEQNRLKKTVGRTIEAGAATQPDGIVGDSPAIRAVLEKIRRVAGSQSTVLLRGESGTGKELFARALHELSPRNRQPFITVNCAALTETLLESELFGHEKGAFSGALAQRRGRFELADGGTLLLDEIGEISPAFQKKLLRVLQEGSFERVGGTATLEVDVRVVAATNKNLEEAVARGEFRLDLYYRINVVPIFLPPLRDRQADIPLLAREFLHRYNTENGTELTLGGDALSVLTACCFPGNVRELENCIRRTATFAPGPELGATDFACRNDECLSSMLWNPPPRPPRSSSDVAPVTNERERLIEAMEASGWVQAKAARLLGVTARQLGYALRKHDVDIKKL